MRPLTYGYPEKSTAVIRCKIKDVIWRQTAEFLTKLNT
jgi:hypothetical protein